MRAAQIGHARSWLSTVGSRGHGGNGGNDGGSSRPVSAAKVTSADARDDAIVDLQVELEGLEPASGLVGVLEGLCLETCQRVRSDPVDGMHDARPPWWGPLAPGSSPCTSPCPSPGTPREQLERATWWDSMPASYRAQFCVAGSPLSGSARPSLAGPSDWPQPTHPQSTACVA